MVIVVILVLLLTLQGLSLCFLWLMMSFGLGEIYFIMLRKYPFLLSAFFFHEWVIIFVNFFSIFVDITVNFFLRYINMINYIIYPCIPGIIPIMIGYFSVCHYILFVNILFRILEYVFIKVIGLLLSYFHKELFF